MILRLIVCIPIELNIAEHRRKVGLTVYRPDGTAYHTEARRTEQPGTWFHPLLATVVAAGGRLLLATAIALLREAGGSYVFCDTDSVFAAATRTGNGNDGVPTLSWERAISIAGRFESLNPYDSDVIPGSILELEPENLDPETGGLREVRCFRSPPNAMPSTPPTRTGGRRSSATPASASAQNTDSVTSSPHAT
jgi:hypothetical protein